MDGRWIIRAALKEAGSLGLGYFERIALILAVSILIVLGRSAWDVVKNLPVEPQTDPEAGPPSPVVDGNGNPIGFGPDNDAGGG